MWADFRSAYRTLRRSPAFASIAVISLGLGIGANVGTFSLLNALVLRNLPVPQPDRLVRISLVRQDGTRRALSFPMFDELQREPSMFSSMAGWWGDRVSNVETGSGLTHAGLWAVTPGFYQQLGVMPALGRFFDASDRSNSERKADFVAVLGYDFWRRQFAESPAAIGQTIQIEGIPFTVIGVAPRRFTGVTVSVEPEVTIPLTAVALIGGRTIEEQLSARHLLWVNVLARLDDHLSIDQANARLRIAQNRIVRELAPADHDARQRAEFESMRLEAASAARGTETYLRTRYTRPLYAVLAIAGLVLLIGCANLASLMVSRAVNRRHEIGVRLALGATRAQLARHVLAESLLLAAAGACAGFIVAYWGSRAISAMILQGFLVPAALDVRPDIVVTTFACAISLLAACLFSIAPAWTAMRQNVSALLQHSARTGSNSRAVVRSLVVLQVALTIVLLVDAGLLVRSTQQLRAFDPGFKAQGLIGTGLFPRPGGYTGINFDAYYPELVKRVAAVPEVRSVALANLYPGAGFEDKTTVFAQAQPGAAGSLSALGRVSPRFFSTLGMTLISGRDFDWRDAANAPRVAIASRSLAAHLFGTETPLGEYIQAADNPKRGALQIVGAVSDARLYNVREPNLFAVYLPLLQEGSYAKQPDVLVQAGAPAETVISGIRRAVQSLGREDLLDPHELQRVIDRAMLQERITALLAGFFGALALLLSVVGLYGLMLYAASQRMREFAIRVALGAQRSEIRRIVVGEGIGLVLVGIAIGVPFALLSTRIIRGLLFGLTPFDPMTLLSVAALLAFAGALAGWLPARRAARTDPLELLKA